MASKLTPQRKQEIRYLLEWWPTYGDEGHDALVDAMAEIDRLCTALKPLLEDKFCTCYTPDNFEGRKHHPECVVAIARAVLEGKL